MPPRTKRAYTRHIGPKTPPASPGASAAPAGQAAPPATVTPPAQTEQGNPATRPLADTFDLAAPVAPAVNRNGHHPRNDGLPRKADGMIDYDRIGFSPDTQAAGVTEAEEIRTDLIGQVASLVSQGQQANPALEHLDPESIDKKIKVSRIRRGQEMSVLFFRMIMATTNPSEQKRIIPITLETMLALTIGAGGLGIEDRLKIMISQIRANSAPDQQP